MTHGDYFSGIGNWSYVARQLDITTLFHCEKSGLLRKLLDKHLPGIQNFGDIKKFSGMHADIFTASFPCQDLSINNKNIYEGIKGTRSGLFFEFAKHVRLYRPSYVVLENVPNLLNRGFEYVLDEFSKIGYVCEWQCLSGTTFGYPHQRERLFVVAYPNKVRRLRSVFIPIKVEELFFQWSPSNADLLLTELRNAGQWNFENFPKYDGPKRFNFILGSLGNSVITIICEYIFKCIINHSELCQENTQNH